MPAARPICAVADAGGADLSLGVLVGIDERCLQVFAPPLPHSVGSLRLGAMWARSGATGWDLIDQLLPATA